MSSGRASRGLWLAIAVIAAAACGGEDFTFTGEPGRRVAAPIEAWVPAVEILVDGAGSGMMLVDTGAPVIVLDTESFGLQPRAYRADLETFGLGFPELLVAAFDVFPDSAPWDGIIGGELLRHFTLGVDYRNEMAWLGEAHEPTAADDELEADATASIEVRGGGVIVIPGNCSGPCGELEVGATRALVPVTLEGREPLWFMVDTGASAVVLMPSVVAALGGTDRPRMDGVTINTSTGTVLGAYVRVGSVVIGDARVPSVSALVIPDDRFLDGLSAEVGVPVSGLIGGSFLREFRVALDYPQRILSLAAYRDRSHIDPDEFIGVGFTMARPGTVWEVGDVYTGTDAFDQGLRPGEVLVELDGVSLGGANRSAVDAILDRFALGDDVPVGVARGGPVETLLIAVEDLLPAYETP